MWKPQPQRASKEVARPRGRINRREAEHIFRYSALRKSDAKSGEWVVIGMISSVWFEIRNFADLW